MCEFIHEQAKPTLIGTQARAGNTAESVGGRKLVLATFPPRIEQLGNHSVSWGGPSRCNGMHTGGTQQFRLGQIGFLDLKQLQSPARTACSAPTSGAHICTRFLTTASFRRWNVASHRNRAALLASRRICRLQCHRPFDRVCNIDPAADVATNTKKLRGVGHHGVVPSGSTRMHLPAN